MRNVRNRERIDYSNPTDEGNGQLAPSCSADTRAMVCELDALILKLRGLVG